MFKILLCIILVVACYLLMIFGREYGGYVKRKRPVGNISLYFIFGAVLIIVACVGWYHVGRITGEASMVILK